MVFPIDMPIIKMKRILITGVTGFLGSNIARRLIQDGFELIATKRTTSRFDKCQDIANDIIWIDVEKNDWKDNIRAQEPDMLIHTAWGGVSADDRSNWSLQLLNFSFSKELFDLAVSINIKRILSLGSQAEYGCQSSRLSEDALPIPEDAYASVKLLSLYYLRQLSIQNNVQWNWIRVFSVFGKGENENWLIPSVLNKLRKGEPVELTEGLQRYDYLHIDDFLDCIEKMISITSPRSGIYNICSGVSISIRELLLKMADLLGVSKDLLKFGTIPYRSKQNMLIEGSNMKFKESFDFKDFTPSFDRGLKKLIGNY